MIAPTVFPKREFSLTYGTGYVLLLPKMHFVALDASIDAPIDARAARADSLPEAPSTS